MRQDWSEGNGQYKQYKHIDIDFFNIIQPAWDTEWIITADEAHDRGILRVKIFAEHFKTV